MSNKFRIVEQRGVFRIQQTIYRIGKYKSSWFFGVKVKDGTEDLWDEMWDSDACLNDTSPTASCDWTKYIYEFDTYKKAENYIKKFYGSTGVDAIEKPEWRTA